MSGPNHALQDLDASALSVDLGLQASALDVNLTIQAGALSVDLGAELVKARSHDDNDVPAGLIANLLDSRVCKVGVHPGFPPSAVDVVDGRRGDHR